MKKNYFEPSIEITAFDAENIVTGSSLTGTSADETAFNAAPETARRTVSYDAFKFTF